MLHSLIMLPLLIKKMSDEVTNRNNHEHRPSLREGDLRDISERTYPGVGL